MLIEIAPQIRTDAELKIRRFYYTGKLSFSLANQNISITEESLIFYFIHEDTTIQTIEFPVEPLYSVDELWIDGMDDIEHAKLYTEQVFDSYSYYLKGPF